MSVLTHQTVTIHHAPAAVLQAVAEQVRQWRKRAAQRAELARWGERELHDVGLSWADVASEVEKPFWRA